MGYYIVIHKLDKTQMIGYHIVNHYQNHSVL